MSFFILAFLSQSILDFSLVDGILTIGSSGKLTEGKIGSIFTIDLIKIVIFDTNGDTYLENNAFFNYPNLMSCHLSSSVVYISETAFRFCKSLSNITVESSNNYFVVQDQILYDKAKQTIIKVPVTATNVAIQDTVTTIKNHAFHFIKKMTSLFIPKTVMSIEPGAFYDSHIDLVEFQNDSELKTLVSNSFSYTFIQKLILPSTLEIIESYAIHSYSNLFSVEFREPKKLTIKEYAIFDTSITSLTIPANVIIKENAFNPFNKLHTVNISEYAVLEANSFAGCPYISNFSKNGNIYDKDGFIFNGTTLIYVQQNTSDHLHINSSIHISNPSIQYSQNLTNLTITGGFVNNSVIYENSSFETVIAAAGGLEYINFPNTVKYLGGFCFTGMKKLKKLIINSDIQIIHSRAFYQCNVPEIHFKTVSEIKERAFKECYATNITFEDGPYIIGESAFQSCNLQEIILRNTTSISAQTFMYSNVMTAIFDDSCSASSTGIYVFLGCKNLKSVTLHSRIEVLETQMFGSCYNLCQINFHPNMQKLTIGDKCFYQTSIERFEFNSSLNKISANAFLNCLNLREKIINSIPSKVEGGIFYQCSNLKKIVVHNIEPLKVENLKRLILDINNRIKEIISYSSYHPDSLFANFISLESVFINSSTISNSLFENCTSLRTVHFQNANVSVGIKSFYNCRNLDHSILRNISSIGDFAFYGCRFPYSIIIPKNIVRIGSFAISNSGIIMINYCSENILCKTDSFDSNAKAFVTEIYNESQFCSLETMRIDKSICHIPHQTNFSHITSTLEDCVGDS